MTDIHSDAVRLIGQDRVEGITPAEREWLDLHLAACADCGALAGSTEDALQSLRRLSIALPPTLARRTQVRVQLRLAEMQGRQSRRWALWTACGVSWALGAATGPYVWRGFEWIGRSIGLPGVIWQTGFILWWALPAVVAAGILLIENAGRAASNYD